MPHAETPRAETPPHNELPNEMLALIACLCMEHRPHELATERIATECAQDAGKWSHLAATLPPLVELSRTSEAARGRIGEALAPSARAALSHAASTINAAFPAADTDAAENAAGAPTLSSEASASTAMSTEGPAEMVLGITLLCRLLRNTCARQPTVQAALFRADLFDALVALLDACTSASPAAASTVEDCARAAAQMGANICVGHAEALSALWQGGGNALLGRLLGSHTSPALVTIGLMMLYNAVRGQPERLRNLVVKGAGDDEQEGGGGGGGGGAATGLWLPAALHLLAALHLVDAKADAKPGSGADGVGHGHGAGRHAPGGGTKTSGGKAIASGGDSSWALLIFRELLASGMLLHLIERAHELDAGSAAATAAANFPSGSALGLTYVAVLCDAIDSVCDDEGDACAGMERGAGITIARRLTTLLGRSVDRSWWVHGGNAVAASGPDAAGSAEALYPPPECCECVCLLRVAGDLALRAIPPFGIKSTASSPAFSVTCAGPDAAIDVVAGSVRALAKMGQWQPPSMLKEEHSRTRSGGAGGSGAADAAISPHAQQPVQTLSMEREMVRLLALLSHQRPVVQARVRELEGLVPVLQRCQLDDRNPQVREWAILAIRYLTEDEANRAFIEKIERAPREVANVKDLEREGLEVKVDRETGRVRVKQSRPPPQSDQRGASSTGTTAAGSLDGVAEEKDEMLEALEELEGEERSRLRLHRVEL